MTVPMTVLYLDSNALAKLYLDEDDTEQERVIALLNEHQGVACSAITHAEIGGVLARLLHAALITEAQYTDKLERFLADWETVNVLDVLPDTSVRAVQVMKAQPGLRAMDALHLASALALRTRNPVRFLTFDARLNGAAARLMPDALT